MHYSSLIFDTSSKINLKPNDASNNAHVMGLMLNYLEIALI